MREHCLTLMAIFLRRYMSVQQDTHVQLKAIRPHTTQHNTLVERNDSLNESISFLDSVYGRQRLGELNMYNWQGLKQNRKRLQQYDMQTALKLSLSCECPCTFVSRKNIFVLGGDTALNFMCSDQIAPNIAASLISARLLITTLNFLLFRYLWAVKAMMSISLDELMA